MDPLESNSRDQTDNLKIQTQIQPLISPSKPVLEGDEFWPLSGKPYFDIVFAKSHVRPRYQLALPAKMHAIIPSLLIPAILTYRGKIWEMVCNGTYKNCKRFDYKWRNFVDDNDLKAGDACVFELTECSCKILKFRVQILRGDLPSELRDKINGESANNPVIVD